MGKGKSGDSNIMSISNGRKSEKYIYFHLFVTTVFNFKNGKQNVILLPPYIQEYY